MYDNIKILILDNYMDINLFESYTVFPKTSCVYKITCMSSGRFYIGASISFRKRMKDHRNYLLRGNHVSQLMQEDFDKYGKDSFKTEIIENFNCIIPFKSSNYKELLLKKEEEYITKFNPEYNTQQCPYSDYGDLGNSIPVYQYDLDGNFIKAWKSQAEVASVLGFNPQAAFTHQSAGGFQWSKEKVDKMPKYRRLSGIKARRICSVYDLFGKRIKTFDCLVDLADYIYGTHNKQTQLRIQQLVKSGRGVNNKYRIAYGCAEQLDNSLNLKLERRFIVVQYDLNGNFVNIWETLATALNTLGLRNERQQMKDANGNVYYKTQNYIFKKLGS